MIEGAEMGKTFNLGFEVVPSTESCTRITVDVTFINNTDVRFDLRQQSASLPSEHNNIRMDLACRDCGSKALFTTSTTRNIIKMDQDQARKLIEMLQRALELLKEEC